MSTIFESASGHIYKDTTDGGECLSDNQDDLMLAAELGKSLLERNRELEAALRMNQEYADEQSAQAEFYIKQIEILREEIETSYHTCEQLEANNQILSNKCEQWRNEFKILEGKNSRLWDVINSLEMRIEELTTELTSLRDNIIEMTVSDESEQRERQNEILQIYQTQLKIDDETPIAPACELEIVLLKKQVSELNIQIKLIKLQRSEFECQLEDVINENQVLYHKISILNQEIIEWENFAQKEENYRRLAAAFTLKHCIETESNVENIFEIKSKEISSKKSNIKRAKSCECLSYNDKHIDFLKSPNLVNNILSSVNSSSFLSELDTEYSELVKRYEALLDKYKQDSKLNENPDRTRKVQKAIQTLSLNFSNIPMLSSPGTPQKEKIFSNNGNDISPVKKCLDISSQCMTPSLLDKKERTMLEHTVSEKSSLNCSEFSCSSVSTKTDSLEILTDYRMMFSEIFATLKKSKEVYS